MSQERSRESPVRSQRIAIPYPAAPTTTLEIVVGAPGEVRLGGGAAGALVTGTIEYNREIWAARVEERAGRVRLVQGERFEDKLEFGFEAVNRWNLQLGAEKPYALEIKSGVNRGRWELGGLPITDLLIETGVSENIYTFEAPNPETMKNLELKCGVASVELDGLLNAGFRRMDVKGGVGNVTLRLTGGALRQDARLKIEGGVGQFAVVVSEGVRARARVTGLVGVTTRGSFRQRSGGFPFGGDYATTAYDSGQGPQLEIEITAGVSSIILETTHSSSRSTS